MKIKDIINGEEYYWCKDNWRKEPTSHFFIKAYLLYIAMKLNGLNPKLEN